MSHADFFSTITPEEARNKFGILASDPSFSAIASGLVTDFDLNRVRNLMGHMSYIPESLYADEQATEKTVKMVAAKIVSVALH